jgi:6-phosphogluconate dehydrogenase
MPGGSIAAYRLMQQVLESIAAKVNDDSCVTYIGDNGAGHFVKMVHNGIEYGIMGLIAEAYDLLRNGLGIPVSEISRIFGKWNQGELASYLMDITSRILTVNDEKTDNPLVDMILDSAGQKGTGLWLAHHALDMGASAPTIHAALDGRIISGYSKQRVMASTVLAGPQGNFTGDRSTFISQLSKALNFSILCDFAQGIDVMKKAAEQYHWGLNYGDIARIWRGGCIIRAELLEDIQSAYSANRDLVNLLLDPQLAKVIGQGQDALRWVISKAVRLGRPVPVMSASLAYYDAFRSARLPANLIQAQRDFFGAHTYARIDLEGTFHTDWKTTATPKR